ncbi:MAG: bifunctional [glutamate--ammonia ligase]-adenylyl-L-tyrosine phosphorylase/[glutamate--ammonia-ligase] adenylyltransferase [Xanthomonadales bacterium]|jgi:glutamate-ammonia-ligase adenylyltransferase|nr:bifunctional [glutamate--ammonia ligase]-adenylyl-L-tyrosine phosphorylase/[glutamate--ammonia-ligase] adenylyltransferase [Xanthomonadales bacterium]
MNAVALQCHAQAEARVAAWLHGLDALDRKRVTASLRRGLHKLALVSDFAVDELARQPALLLRLRPRASQTLAFTAEDADRAAREGRLGELRRADSVLQIWRDVLGLDDAMRTCARATAVAEGLIAAAVRQAQADLAPRHGVPQAANGVPLGLLVVGMGKLGGGELNFSSDIDLICTYAEPGETGGPRPLEHQEYFSRAVTRVVQALTRADSGPPAYRVDLRLRPFGSSGPTALSFDAMEQYYQREGRDWERYAWIKGRVLTGSPAEAAQLHALMRPFVFRRYLDYGAFAGLRELKARIDQEVRRRDMSDHLKLGRGGIREVEFTLQLTQLIRGGREPGLRVRGTLEALAAMRELGLIEADAALRLAEAYRLLRQVENRVQMLDDAQTHELPRDPERLARIALGLGYPEPEALRAALQAAREVVARQFDAILLPSVSTSVGADPLVQAWQQLSIRPQAELSADHVPALASTAMQKLAGSVVLKSMNAISRSRLDAVLPRLLGVAAAAPEPERVTRATVDFVQAVARRSIYLALLKERPGLIERLVQLFAQSEWVARRVISAPILLDDVLDRERLARFGAVPFAAECSAALAGAGGDTEARLLRLREFQLSAQVRLALAFLEGVLPAADCARHLAEIGDLVVQQVLALARTELCARHGEPGGAAGSGFAVLGYGSLGGQELNFASDLDLVFVYEDRLAEVDTTGPSVIDGQRWFGRLAQRVLALLTMPSAVGELYAIDTRLQPDGNKAGLLVTGIKTLARYQRDRAWTFEHQALVRARFVAGDRRLARRFRRLRDGILGLTRDPPKLAVDIAAMRLKMRQHLDRSDAERYDLKQGPEGLVDIEFAVQQAVLGAGAGVHWPTRTAELFDALVAAGRLQAARAEPLRRRHEALLQASLACTLRGEARCLPRAALAAIVPAPMADPAA